MARRKASRRSKSHKKTNNFIRSLLRLKKLNRSDRTKAISMANNQFINKLCQHVKKLKRATVPLKVKKNLRKHGRGLRTLLNKRTSTTKRRALLTQRGGGILDSILSSIPVIGSIYDIIKTV